MEVLEVLHKAVIACELGRKAKNVSFTFFNQGIMKCEQNKLGWSTY